MRYRRNLCTVSAMTRTRKSARLAATTVILMAAGFFTWTMPRCLSTAGQAQAQTAVAPKTNSPQGLSKSLETPATSNTKPDESQATEDGPTAWFTRWVKVFTDALTPIGALLTVIVTILTSLVTIGSILAKSNPVDFTRGLIGWIKIKRVEPKRAEEALQQLRERIANPPPRIPWDERFTRTITITEAEAATVEDTAKLIVVASGKGGVGKSTLALGLTEAYCRDTRKTLLIDFDMHNRGLTSLLQVYQKGGQSTSCFKEMLRFHKDASPALKSNGYVPGSVQKNNGPTNSNESRKVDRVKLRDLMDQYSGYPVWKQFETISLIEPNTSVKVRGVDVPWDNAFFLPSLLREERFLGSEIFEIDFVHVFFFLKYLAYWARHKLNVSHVIVDCHGAHDLLMIGAIHAASGLVLATQPEPGAFDGTYDLLAFSELVKGDHGRPMPKVLVVNNCRSWQERAASAIEAFVKLPDQKLRVAEVVRIEARDDIREVTSSFSFGQACNRDDLWAAIRRIKTGLNIDEPRRPVQVETSRNPPAGEENKP